MSQTGEVAQLLGPVAYAHCTDPLRIFGHHLIVYCFIMCKLRTCVLLSDGEQAAHRREAASFSYCLL